MRAVGQIEGFALHLKISLNVHIGGFQVHVSEKTLDHYEGHPGLKQMHKRHGTTTLFAALEVLEGRVVKQCFERHRHQEFLRFLRRLDQEFPGPVPLHLVLDNYGTHQHPKARAWLGRHTRLVARFVPTSSSWLHLIERWFGELTSKRVRRDSFHGVEGLEKAIEEFLAAWNEHPNRFSGRQPSNPSPKSSRTAARPWSTFNPDARSRAAEEGRNVVQLIPGHYTSVP